MTQEQKNDNLSIAIFERMCAIDEQVWFGTDSIVNTRGSEKSSRVALRFTPSSTIFPKEFGIRHTRRFISLLKPFSKLNFEFKNEYVHVRDDEGSCLSYRLPGEATFKKKLKSIQRVSVAYEESLRMINENKFIHFELTSELLSKIKSAGRTIQEGDTVSVLTMKKTASTEAMLLSVQNPDSEHSSSWNLGINNNGQFLDFERRMNIDNLPDGNWDAYVFSMSEKIQRLGNMPAVWMYLKDKENPIDAIVVYNLEK